MKRIRKASRFIAVFLVVNLLTELVFPTAAYALTSGPSQPEVQSFEPIGTSEMVDVFSGDFTYNIPLLDIEGYPINISYNSGITIDQEASWVGLGWNINPGVINRNMRGIPDDFNGDLYERELNLKDNITVGLNAGVGYEFFGAEEAKPYNGFELSASLGIRYNNYKGVGFEVSANGAITAGKAGKGRMTGGLGISSSDDGLTISPNISFSSNADRKTMDDFQVGGNVGVSFNRRSGLQQMSFGLSANTNRASFLPTNRSSSLTFGVQTYTPTIGNQMVNGTYTLGIKAGTTITGQDFTGNLSGYYSSQRIANPVDRVPAYGYMNLQNGVDLEKVNLDYNREKDGSFTVNTPVLPVTNLTYDVYSVAGQGIGGAYRMFRGDVGSVFDSYESNTSQSGNLDYEWAVGNAVHNGLNVAVTDVNTYTKKWENAAASRLRFRKNANYEAYEPAYFRESGEKSVDSDPSLYQSLGSDYPVNFEMGISGDEYGIGVNIRDTKGGKGELSKDNYRKSRQKRNQAITYLTRGEMKRFGLDNQLKHTYNAPDHHIGQITTLRPDGARYIFGIAAYNTAQEETSFNAGRIKGGFQYPDVDAKSGLIRYRSSDNTSNNDRGLDNYYSNTKTPAFAHSYLLTAVLSNDYVDIDNVRGPSPGDMGTYTKFTYTKVEKPYKWRTPFEQFQANYNEGMKSDDLDDQGNYIYGEKELWYVEKIETKNYIAVFTLEDRDDAYGVKNRNGGKGDVTMKLLRKISLYTRAEFESSANPVPIKEVHFEYDYSLCQNIPNQKINGMGKLTLKKLYFTYQNSYKAKFNAYNFSYSGQNPNYNQKSQDRWGNYKENAATTYNPASPIVSPAEFPYTDQDKAIQDLNAESWNLKEIELPSGGKIAISYESDDYAYVQDKRAMEMFKIHSVGAQENDVVDNPSNQQSLYTPVTQEYLFFELKSPVDGATDPADYKPIIERKYVAGIQDLYFRFLVNITNENGVDKPEYNNAYEYVSGYCEVEDFGLSSFKSADGKYHYGFVKVKKVKISDNNIVNTHPIAKAAWNFGKLHLPRHVYRQQDPNDAGVEQLILALSNKQTVRNIFEFALGANGLFYASGYGRQFYAHKSWIRLNSPNQKKLGGGCRVSKVELSDEWASMVSGQNSFSYGQEYDYTTTNEFGDIISSGVAPYEPGIGADENPFKLPIYHGDKEQKVLAPDEDFYTEAPVGESFFPAPGVGYSKVTVKNLQYENVTRNATGKIVHEFFTAKDYPTITRRSGLNTGPYKTNPIIKMFTFKSKDYMTATQGFAVILNDMHGKQKKQLVYAENQSEPISGVEYIYKSKPLGKGTYQLDNEATVIHPDGSSSTATIGLDYDFVADMRSQTSKVVSASGNFNLSLFQIAGIPLPVPTAFPGYNVEETRFKSATTTKVINQSAILTETIAYDLGSRVSTKNLAYDSETGEVLLTQTVNSFNDPVYTLNYPAHWYYDGMGQAYKNIGITIQDVTLPNLANANQYFFPGDEIMFTESGSGSVTKLWVDATSSTTVSLINELGEAHSGTGTLKVIRSGRRNLQSLSIGSITSLTNPMDNLQSNTFAEVLQASAVVFTDSWKTFCDCFSSPNGEIVLSKNPYVTGQKGIWRNNRSYLHLSDRSQSYQNKNTNIRKDGVFTSYNPFWRWSENNWQPDEQNWTWVTTITQFNPNGQELENQDALGRYSAGVYAYNNTLTVGIGANLKYSEIAFDAFEDYSFLPCSQDHFSYRPFSGKIDNQESHTGSHSIKVSSGDNVTITKPTVPCQ